MTAIRAKANPLRPRTGLLGEHGYGWTRTRSGLAEEGARDGAATAWAILDFAIFAINWHMFPSQLVQIVFFPYIRDKLKCKLASEIEPTASTWLLVDVESCGLKIIKFLVCMRGTVGSNN